MSDQPKNLEEIPQGGTHVLNIRFLTKANGVPTNPDGFTPGDDPTVTITVVPLIYNISAGTYSTPPVGYNTWTADDLRYAGVTGEFLITANSPANTKLSSDLVGERWAAGWTTTINNKSRTFYEFVTVVDGAAAEFGDTGYCDIDCVREDVVQLVKSETYVITGAAPTEAGEIKFPDNNTKQITKVIVNDVELTSGFTFKKPGSITFSPALAINDIVEITRDVCMTDAAINKDIVDVTNYINGQISKVYNIPFTAPYPPLLETLCRKLTGAEIRMKLFDSTDSSGDRRGTEQWKRWHQKLMEIKEQEVELIDANGDLIETRVGSGIVSNTDNLEPIFSMDDIRDINEYGTDTDWKIRRRGF